MLESIQYSFEVHETELFDMIEISSDGNNVHAYQGFVTTLEFNKDGSLKTIGIYE